jgi:fructokinase
MPQAVALGEVLIDFTPLGVSETGNPVFERNPGGAPANVLSLLSKLGIETAFIGKAGDDMFGSALKNILDKAGIDTSGLILSQKYNTTLAFVELDESGDRSFGFVRKNGADKMLDTCDVNLSLLDGAKVFHFGGVSLTGEPSRTATLNTAREAKKRGLVVSYDPNYRPPLWSGNDAAEVLREGVKLADILKVSDEECRMLSQKEDLREGTEYLMKTYGVKLVFVTLGAKGAAFRLGGDYKEQKTFDVKTVDTTGAGDAFFGGILYCLLKSGKRLTELETADVDGFMRFANAAGSIVTTKKGAILSMPTLQQINGLMENGKLLD